MAASWTAIIYTSQIETPAKVLLLNQVNRAFEELVERRTLEHTVLQQCQVDELMHNFVAFGIVADYLVALVTLLVHGLLGVLRVVFLLLCNLFSLLLALRLMQSGKPCLAVPSARSARV